jgi:hypothetical protein
LDAGVTVAIVTAAVSAALSLLSLFLAGRANIESKRANHLTVLDFLREYRDAEDSRRYVFRELSAVTDPALGISALPDGARVPVIRVFHFLDHLGFLVSSGIIDQVAVSRLMGLSVLRSWKVLGPYIEREREARNQPDCGVYFEDLTERLRCLQGKTAKRHRRLLRVPANADLPGPIDFG